MIRKRRHKKIFSQNESKVLQWWFPDQTRWRGKRAGDADGLEQQSKKKQTNQGVFLALWSAACRFVSDSRERGPTM